MSKSKREKDRYIPGDYNVTCDYSGFKIKRSEARFTWDGLLVRKDLWEPRQPQDFVRGVKEDIAVEDPRPAWENPQFLTKKITPDDLP